MKITDILCITPEDDRVLLVKHLFYALKSFSLKQKEAWLVRCVGYKQQSWDKKVVSMVPIGKPSYNRDSLLLIALFPVQAGDLQFIEFVSCE